MYQEVVLVSILLASAMGQTAPVKALSKSSTVQVLEPGQPFTTGFSADQVGSQFYIWLPKNISSVLISWERSPSGAGTCSSGAFAYLFGKWGSWPCASTAYQNLNDFCETNSYFGYSAASSLEVSLDAYHSQSMSYWKSQNTNDLIRGDYLFLASYMDLANQQCTATINITLEYCPNSTIAAEAPSGTQCVAYTNITGGTYSQSVVSTAPFQKFWMVNVPGNSSGVQANVTNSNGTYLYMLGRLSSAGSATNYYGTTSSSGNLSLWWPNLPSGEFIITVESTSTLANVQFDISIEVHTCPADFSSGEQGDCKYPLTTLQMNQLGTPTVVTVPASSVSGSCNWIVYAFSAGAPWALESLNLTVTENSGSSGSVFLRKNSWPTQTIYDDYASTTYTWNFTPEDFYTGKNDIYYIGFCNTATDQTSSWTFSGQVPSPSPTSSPVPVSPSSTPSPSGVPSVTNTPSPSPEADSSASMVLMSVVTLAALVLLV